MAHETTIRAMAARQHGVVAWWQLRAAGVPYAALRNLQERGRVRRVHRGVFAFDATMTRRGRIMAAVLAVGPDGVASHDTAAYLHGHVKSGSGSIHVTAGGGQRSRPGILVHHGRLIADDVVIVDGIPVTTPGRTLLDCAESIRSQHRFHKLIDGAFDCRSYDHADTLSAMARHPHRRGTHRLARALEEHVAGAYRGENPFEDLLAPILQRHGIPLPQTQVPMALSDGTAIRVDAAYPRARLIIELDGGTHLNPRRREHDAHRDALLGAAGWTVLRFTFLQLTRRPETVAAAIRARLTAAG